MWLSIGFSSVSFFLLLLWIRDVEHQKAGEIPLRSELQPLPTSCKYINPTEVAPSPLVCTCLQTVEGGTADSAPPPAAHSYPSNKIPWKRWWNWLYSWDDVRTCNLWLHKVTDCLHTRQTWIANHSLIVLPFFLFVFSPDSLDCSFVVAPCLPGLDRHAKNSNHRYSGNWLLCILYTFLCSHSFYLTNLGVPNESA